jgi:hypothetical protein
VIGMSDAFTRSPIGSIDSGARGAAPFSSAGDWIATMHDALVEIGRALTSSNDAQLRHALLHVIAEAKVGPDGSVCVNLDPIAALLDRPETAWRMPATRRLVAARRWQASHRGVAMFVV